MAVASLVLGLLSLPTFGLLGVGALAGLILGVMALVKANRTPEEFGGKGLAIAGIVCNALSFVMIPVIGIIAAIAIPSLLRARVSANEASAIGDIRTVISAEMAYSSANGSYYDSLECLGTPTRCIPEYPATAPTFVDSMLASGATKNGYRRTFHPGPAPASVTGPVSPTSLTSFAYVAVPLNPGQTGVRGFCGDSEGKICYTTDGSSPPIENGVCAPGCTMLN
ncbi:MAG: DUF4190 domain-containing protein [Acidobacteria bacterium]|nr:DUF4190 domain-containing protein [Acidobacteriota bacterium]